MLWNLITVVLVILCLVVLAIGFPGMIGRRAKFGFLRLPPPKKRDGAANPPPR